MSTGYVKFEFTAETWPGCGYDKKTTEVQVRRVKTEDRDEAQIEVSIDELKGAKHFSKNVGFVLSPEEAKRFAEALMVPCE